MSSTYEINERVHNGANYETANSWDAIVNDGETPKQAFAREYRNPTVRRDCAGSMLVLVKYSGKVDFCGQRESVDVASKVMSARPRIVRKAVV